MPSKLVSVDGGVTRETGEDILDSKLTNSWDALLAAMDPDHRLQVQSRCTEDEQMGPEVYHRDFIRLYLERATVDLVTG